MEGKEEVKEGGEERGVEHLLGSNDPNTIPDPTRSRCSRSRMCSMFPLGLRCVLDLATFYVSSDSVLSGYVLL